MKKKRQESKLRWIVLLLNCFSNFSSVYCFDNVTVLHDALKNDFSDLGENFETYFNLLYSVYSIPNIILPLIAGVLIIKFGLRFMSIFYGFFIVFGQFIIALGCQINSIYIMLLGRLLFGLGSESIGICQYAFVVKWFYKSENALPLGLTVSIGRISSVLNALLSPSFSVKYGVNFPLWFGFGVCVFSYLTNIILCIIDVRIEENFDISFVDVTEKGTIKDFNRLFWILLMIILFFYGTLLPFGYIASGFLIDNYFQDINKDDALILAGIYMSLPFLISTIAVPIIGSLADMYGKRAYWLIISNILALITFGLFFVTYPLIPFIILGISYSIFAAVIWPCISIVVEKHLVVFII